MAVPTGILPDDLGSSPSREPLQPRASSPSLSVTKRIRRKSSFIRRPDSSEDFPSPHDSIYEAVYFSATTSDSSSNRIELIDIPPRRSGSAPVTIVHNDENQKASDVQAPPSIDQIEFRYGWGTALATIREQKSNTTIRTTGRPKSADDIHTIPYLGHQDSFNLAKSPRRKESFSFDDFSLVQKSYHEACATIEREIFKLPINEIYAEPKTPIKGPPERPGTPDGMPSWTAAQNSPRHPAPPRPVQNAFQRIFSLPRFTLSRVPRPGSGQGDRSASAPVRGRMAPRFRPPRSVYGPIDQHPFANAPVAQVKTESQVASVHGASSAIPTAIPKKAKGKPRKLQRVRFTPSATARDSEMISLQTAMESTSTLAIHPLAPMQPSPSRSKPTNTCPHRHERRKGLRGLVVNIDPPNLTPIDGQISRSEVVGIGGTNSETLTTPQRSLIIRNGSGSIGAMAQAANSTSSLVLEDPRSRTTSFSSTAYLMAGGLASASGSTLCIQPEAAAATDAPKQKHVFCWKCAAQKTGEKISHWWKSSASCVCFVCCGFDLEDEMDMHNNGASPNYPVYRPQMRGPSSLESFGSRSATLARPSVGSF